ncbi:MAG TPA: redoxin domain-containing protein [Planctomycetes bacterium]|nr:redoxin domain-containing protein [Planctomycetota bacterium]
MASRSPEDDKADEEYLRGWESIGRMVIEEDASWSGREKNVTFLNLGNGTFADVSNLSHANTIADGRALVLCDWDDDGAEDMLLRNRTAPRLMFYRNAVGSGAHFLTLDLVGTRSNRDAIGSRVRVFTDGRVLTQSVHAGDGFLAESSRRLHFGLGDADSIERVEVRWPDGHRESFVGIEVDRRYRIVEGQAEPEPVARRGNGRLASLPASPLALDDTPPRMDLVEKLPLAPISVPSYDDPDRTVADLAGRRVLVNLWGLSCAACRKELKEFSEHREDLERAGITLVPLSTDPADRTAESKRVLADLGFDAWAGVADERFLDPFQVILTQLMGASRATPLPTSLLLDERGQLVAVYLGPVDLEVLLADAEALERMDPADLGDVRLEPGTWLTPMVRPFGALARSMESIGRKDLARFYRRLGRSR